MLTNCLEDELTRPNIELALKEGRLLWLDLQGTGDEVLTLLRDVFKIHPLAVEDVKEFQQRPKIEDYDGFVSIVAYGARELGEPMTEVHCFLAERFLVSVHHKRSGDSNEICAPCAVPENADSARRVTSSRDATERVTDFIAASIRLHRARSPREAVPAW